MVQSCARCGRANPDEAIYCYHDGGILAGRPSSEPLHTSLRPFPHPLLFPSGQVCLNFEQLLQCCQEDWATGAKMLRQGELERFFAVLGRIDLASAARIASTVPDLDRGLDDLLARLPTRTTRTPRLSVIPKTLDLGRLRVGEDRRFEINLSNLGVRLLYGTVTSEHLWLTPGDALGSSHKVFQFSREQTIAVWVRGQHLHANPRPLDAELVVESNGGSITIAVRAETPPQPFPHGAPAGASSPRQLIEKIRLDPRATVELFDSGAVADWYRANGWPYPVLGPSASGLDGVRQFFKALGLPDEFRVPEPIFAIPEVVRPLPSSPESFLTGVVDRQQLIQKVRAAAAEAAPLFDSGAVAAWYEQNGWTYPVPWPRAAGIDAVLQFLKVVESAAPLAVLVHSLPSPVPVSAIVPAEAVRIKESPKGIHLRGNVGERLKHPFTTRSKAGTARPIRAHASSDQSWLDIDSTQLEDARATIVLVVPAVPDRPGETLHARVRVTVNDVQSLVVPVTLSVGERTAISADTEPFIQL